RIVGANISNVSTTGYRASRAGFEDGLGGVGANGQRMGEGVQMTGPESSLGQGALQQTGRPLDLAIQGNGYYVLNGQHGGINGSYYSRDGRFSLDRNALVVTPEGLRLQGFSIDAQGVTSPTIGDLKISPQGNARATTSATLSVNLDPSSAVQTWNPANPSGTSSFSTSVTVYDSLGASHRVD